MRKVIAENERLIVHGGLTKFDNQKLYFSLTCERKGLNGFNRQEILENFPELKGFVDLYLSDIDGIPMHAIVNGYYWLAGALGGCGENYHGGNGIDGKSPKECKEIFKRHMRCTEQEFKKVSSKVRGIISQSRTSGKRFKKEHPKNAVERLAETLKPRWKQEAQDCILRYNLDTSNY